MDWDALAAPWLEVEAANEATIAPVLDAVIARAGLSAGMHVVDIGPGPGVSLLAAARAVGPSGHVLGVEIAPPFVARARQRVPAHVDIVTADAQHYEFTPQAADAAISMFGVMFFDNPVAAFGNIRAALKPGGQLTFGCWGPPAKNPWFTMPGRAAAEVLGPGPAWTPDAPGPMALHDPAKITRILEAAGWSVTVDSLDLILTPEGTARDVADVQMRIGAAAARMRLAREAGTLTEAMKDEIRAGLCDVFAAFRDGPNIRIPAQVNVVSAWA